MYIPHYYKNENTKEIKTFIKENAFGILVNILDAKPLVDNYEKDSQNPVSLHDMSPKTLRQVKGVVGFKIKITDIQAAYKLSQTRKDDHATIIKNLKAKGVTETEIARQIKKHAINN